MDELIRNLTDEFSGWPIGNGSYYLAAVGTDEASEMAAAALDAIETAGWAVVKLSTPGEYVNGETMWNDYPFVRVAPARSDPIAVGAQCEHLYWINPVEARNVAGALLAAAQMVESGA